MVEWSEGSDWGEAAFTPRSIALVGASAKTGKLGYILMRNLVDGYPGTLYPINPGEAEVMGKLAYSRLQDVPQAVDLAVIALPPEACVQAMRDCAEAGARTALVLSGGFAEVGEEGLARQQAMLAVARAGGVRLIGPNCFGLYNCNLGLNASMGFGLPPKAGTYRSSPRAVHMGWLSSAWLSSAACASPKSSPMATKPI